jgi:hypothetical protein
MTAKRKPKTKRPVLIQTSWLEDIEVEKETKADDFFIEADRWEMDIARLHEENA